MYIFCETTRDGLNIDTKSVILVNCLIKVLKHVIEKCFIENNP